MGRRNSIESARPSGLRRSVTEDLFMKYLFTILAAIALTPVSASAYNVSCTENRLASGGQKITVLLAEIQKDLYTAGALVETRTSSGQLQIYARNLTCKIDVRVTDSNPEYYYLTSVSCRGVGVTPIPFFKITRTQDIKKFDIQVGEDSGDSERKPQWTKIGASGFTCEVFNP
jgi:hypothetical protein